MEVATEQELRQLAAKFGSVLLPGDIVLLSGELGAGKTTFVRGYLESLGVTDPVRSPTFNLVQVFDTLPPVMHTDLYRVSSYRGVGLEDYLDSHVCFVEWPDRAVGLTDFAECWQISILFSSCGRTVEITPPTGREIRLTDRQSGTARP